MHGVLVQVNVDTDREEDAVRALHDLVVPRAKAFPGFVQGVWLRALEGPAGRGVLLFESAETAQAAVELLRSEGPPAGAPVTLESAEAYEVLAQA